MASFSTSAEMGFQFRQLSAGVADLTPRGGSSMVLTRFGVIVFGGADRGQSHFNDLAIFSRNKREWRKRESKGDVPTPRSGHATVCFGHFMFLFGGIDFAEEAAYNDLYVLNLETLVWRYVGEAGIEIAARNSHTLAIVCGDGSNDASNYLVIYGGASPDLGPLGETYFAKLPDLEVVASEEFFLTWQLLPSTASQPDAREMHSSCASPSGGGVLIAGGRNENGDVLSDVWELSASSSSSSADSASATATGAAGDDAQSPPLRWKRLSDLTLDVPRCAHGAVVIRPSSDSPPQLCIIGGFTGLPGADAMPDDLRLISLQPASEPASSRKWISVPSVRGMGPRFGVSVCNAAEWVSSPPAASPVRPHAPEPAFEVLDSDADANADADGDADADASELSVRLSLAELPIDAEGADAAEAASGYRGFLLFGGVNAERDFCDVWLIQAGGGEAL